ncbi:hypothetical protein JL720_13967 [Aureococcus anophagefferens]|nr:hypothetical protein JL720_13967 [Aureococcus anophagefferens]
MAESSEDYAQAHADQYREKGNGLFKAGDYAGAVGAYSEAIALDPANHVLYSNRSGAYLALGGAISKAFKDAEQCTSYRKALELAPETPAFVKGLAAARAGEEEATKQRIVEEKRREAEEAARQKAEAERKRKEEEEAAAREELGDFFSALDDDAVARKRAKKAETNPTTEKYATQKLGKGADQIARLTPSHHAFKNLNPFHVLDLDVDATPDDIKARYRKLSALTHPDKNGGADDARRAFEYVKDAYLELSDEKKRAKTVLIFQDDAKRATNVKRQRGAVNFKREAKVEKKPKYGQADAVPARVETLDPGGPGAAVAARRTATDCTRGAFEEDAAALVSVSDSPPPALGPAAAAAAPRRAARAPRAAGGAAVAAPRAAGGAKRRIRPGPWRPTRSSASARRAPTR